MYLPDEYNVSDSFNVADLSPFDVGDAFGSRMNPFKERGNVMQQPTHHKDEHDEEGKDQV